MKALQAKATDLSHHLLRASCVGRYFRSLNLLAWTDLSQQSYGSVTTAPFSYSDVTTFKSSPGIYQLHPCASVYMDYIRSRPWASSLYNPYIDSSLVLEHKTRGYLPRVLHSRIKELSIYRRGNESLLYHNPYTPQRRGITNV